MLPWRGELAGRLDELVIESDLMTMHKVWLGRVDLRAAVRSGSVDLQGPASIVRRVPELMRLSVVAPAVAANRQPDEAAAPATSA